LSDVSEAGVDLNNKFDNVNGRPPLRNDFTRNDPRSQRPEMSGPKNIDSIFERIEAKDGEYPGEKGQRFDNKCFILKRFERGCSQVT